MLRIISHLMNTLVSGCDERSTCSPYICHGRPLPDACSANSDVSSTISALRGRRGPQEWFYTRKFLLSCAPWAIIRSQLIFFCTFCQNQTISTLFSLPDVEINDTCGDMNFTHLTKLMLLHYLAKLKTPKTPVNTNLAFNVTTKNQPSFVSNCAYSFIKCFSIHRAYWAPETVQLICHMRRQISPDIR